MSVHADPRVGSELAGYRIEALLGRGGMADVYRAVDSRLGRRVALKLLAPDLAQDERFRERFLRESRLAASLDHPNVTPVYEAGEVGGLLYIAMRYVEGTDLRRLLEPGPLEPRRALGLLARVADALDAAHARGLVHRDVKPGNVLIALDPKADPPEHPYLSDFGLTKQTSTDSGLTQTGQFVGTADYAAPEQITRQPVGPASDQYALACLLFECLTGQPPYRDEALMAVLWAHVNDPPPKASKRNPELPQKIDPVLARGLAKKPADRYPSCRALVAAARDALDISGELPQTPPAPHPLLRRRELLLAAGAAIAAAAAVPTILLTRGSGSSEPGEEIRMGPTSLIRIDPATNKPVAALEAGVPLLSFPAVAIGEGAVWLADQVGHTVARIDSRTNTLTRTVAVGGSPSDIAVGAGAVWVVGTREGAGTLTKIDAATGSIRGEFALPYSDPVAVAVTADALWIAANGLGGNAIVRLPAASPADVSETIPFTDRLLDVAAHDDVMWATSSAGGVQGTGTPPSITGTRIDTSAARIVTTAELGTAHGTGAGQLAFGKDTAWVIGGDGVVRFDPGSGAVTSGTRIDRNDVYAVAANAGGLWVGVGDQPGELWRIDPGTSRVVARIGLPKATVLAVAADEAGVWAY